MNAIGSLVGSGGSSIVSHILAISLTIVGDSVLYGGYKLTQRGPRVRVKHEAQGSEHTN